MCIETFLDIYLSFISTSNYAFSLAIFPATLFLKFNLPINYLISCIIKIKYNRFKCE